MPLAFGALLRTAIFPARRGRSGSDRKGISHIATWRTSQVGMGGWEKVRQGLQAFKGPFSSSRVRFDVARLHAPPARPAGFSHCESVDRHFEADERQLPIGLHDLHLDRTAA
jgi:hypothetical protein